jgi:hypothetical protein
MALVLVSKSSEGELVNQESREYYRSLDVPELEFEISAMIKNVEGGLGRVNKIMRSKLITALEVLRQRVPHGDWERFLKDRRLNPSTVRNWRARGRHEATRLREILGDSSLSSPRKKKRELSESAAVQLAKAGKRLAETVLQGNKSYAVKLAEDYLVAFHEAA